MGWITRILLRFLLTGVAFFLIATFVPGFEIESWGVAFLAAFIFGLVNTFIRPIIKLITLPITVLTLGLFIFVINLVMVSITAGLTAGFELNGFMPTLIGTVLLTLVSWVINSIAD